MNRSYSQSLLVFNNAVLKTVELRWIPAPYKN